MLRLVERDGVATPCGPLPAPKGGMTMRRRKSRWGGKQPATCQSGQDPATERLQLSQFPRGRRTAPGAAAAADSVDEDGRRVNGEVIEPFEQPD